MSREPSQKRLDAIVDAEKPPSPWRVVWRDPHNKRGQFFCPGVGWARGVADFHNKLLECVPVVDRESLLVYLHEVGHIELKHGVDHYWEELAQCEYEAETYAIKALRAYGIAVPRTYIAKAKSYVDSCIRMKPSITQTEECLRFAYGAKWRDFS